MTCSLNRNIISYKQFNIRIFFIYMKKKFSHVIAHYLPQCLLLISLLTSNVLFPATVSAQEIENTNNVTQEETVPIDTSEDILEEGISTSIYEEEEVVEPLFVFENTPGDLRQQSDDWYY